MKRSIVKQSIVKQSIVKHIIKHIIKHRFAKFCTVGILALFVNTGLLFMFTDTFNIYYMISAVTSYEISIIFNFIMNDSWTFRDSIIPGRSHSFLVRAIHFNWTRTSGAVFSIAILYALTEFLYINYIISNIIAIIIGTLWSYFSSTNIVWKN